MNGMKGKTALITAGVSGIGFGIARAFALSGIRLILTYRDQQQCEAARRWFDSNEIEVPKFLKLDVTDRDQWSTVAEAVGAIDILVNNAAVSVFGPTDEASFADYDWIMGVNFGGAVNGLVTFLPLMKQSGRGGHIVNVASMAAFLPGPQAGIYTASKFALRGLTESLRFNLARHGIGVSLLCPGLTRTNAWNSVLKRPEMYRDSGFEVVDPAAIEAFGSAFDAGMDPLDVGHKTLAGIVANHGLILTHPEFGEDFEAIHRELMAALPDEEPPVERLRIEVMRRAANAAAAAGQMVGLKDLA